MRQPCPVCERMHCAHQPDLPLAPLKPAANLIEFREIRKFAAAVRRQWPGAVITLRPNSEFVHEHECAPDHPADLMTEESDDGSGSS